MSRDVVAFAGSGWLLRLRLRICPAWRRHVRVVQGSLWESEQPLELRGLTVTDVSGACADLADDGAVDASLATGLGVVAEALLKQLEQVFPADAFDVALHVRPFAFASYFAYRVFLPILFFS